VQRSWRWESIGRSWTRVEDIGVGGMEAQRQLARNWVQRSWMILDLEWSWNWEYIWRVTRQIQKA